MKRVLSVVLAGAIALSLGACGKSQQAETLPSATEQSDSTISSTTYPTETETEPTSEMTAPTETSSPTETSAPTTVPETTEALIDGMRPDFKEAMDAYESFYDEYCDLMAKYAKNPTDLTILGQYAGMLQKVGEMDAAFEKWDEDDLNSAELQYYLAVNSRVLQKLAGIMS